MLDGDGDASPADFVVGASWFVGSAAPCVRFLCGSACGAFVSEGVGGQRGTFLSGACHCEGSEPWRGFEPVISRVQARICFVVSKNKRIIDQ